MQNTTLLSTILPIALGLIMLGLGLSLTIEDFRRVIRYPKAVGVALISQMIILPIICFGIAKIMDLPATLAIGMMLLAASPGGSTANLYSHLSGGDVALNISLTAINSLLSLFVLPIIVNLSIAHFMADGQQISMQFGKVIEVFMIVLLPVSIGMLIRAKAPNLAQKLDKPVKIASAVILVIVIFISIYQQRESLISYIGQVGWAVLVFNLMSLTFGYFIPRWLGIAEKQSIAIGMEIGIHNATLAIYLALNVLKDGTMSVPPALYGVLMFFTAGFFGFLVSRRVKNN